MYIRERGGRKEREKHLLSSHAQQTLRPAMRVGGWVGGVVYIAACYSALSP